MNPIDAIQCNLDFKLDGKQFGNIDLRYSDNEHAFDTIPIPIVTIKNGAGPTLLLSAANHGNEYEGQVIVRRLIHDLEPGDINGRLILLPALNYPAMLDNARVSPLDQGNMNRSFPGTENGSPTAAIADYVTRHILPLADAGIDLHSGGDSACYLPCAFLCTTVDPDLTRRNLELVDAFKAPHTYVVRGENSSSGFDPVAHRLGIPFISTELNGGATIDCAATEIGMTGVRGVMQHLGIIEKQTDTKSDTRFMNGIDGSYSLRSPYSGIFEPCCELGDTVSKGELAGRLYSVEEVERSPLEITFESPGTVLVRRSGARVRRGSHLFVVSSEMSRDDVMALL